MIIPEQDIYHQTNIYEIYEAAKLAKDIGCDYLEVKPSYDDFHQLVMHSEKDMKVAKAQIEMAKTLSTKIVAIKSWFESMPIPKHETQAHK